MNNLNILEGYDSYKETTIINRFFKHAELQKLISQLSLSFDVRLAGSSVEGRDLKLIKWGYGSTKVFLWSQMHGDEATGTMALMDLCGYLQRTKDDRLKDLLERQCTLYLLPMVNPDGAETFIRRNAQQIDINRDFLQEASPEARILKQIRNELKPDFGFNLHDQDTLWSVQKTGKPATLSFLAPAYDQALSVDPTREKAMLVIADIFEELNKYLPQQIGLFDDEYEPRAFGDNFQMAGTSTILIEAGGLHGDPEKQQIREYYFLSILKGLQSIAERSFEKQELSNYRSIPKNNKEIFHILIHQIMYKGMITSIGLNAEERYIAASSEIKTNTLNIYSIQDIGDLRYCDAYEVYDGSEYTLTGNIVFDDLADFELLKDDKIILSFSNGIRYTNTP